MHKTNCPNCGAPIEHYYNYQCPYCKTFLQNTKANELIDRIDTDANEIIINNIDIEKSFLQSGWVITIYCTAFPKIKRYFQEETCATMRMPKECGYQFIFDSRMLSTLYHTKKPLEYLFNLLGAHIPPYILDYPPNKHKILNAFTHWEMIEGWI